MHTHRDKEKSVFLSLVIVKELATHFDHYKEIHGVRSRRSGSHVYMDLMLEFDGDKKNGRGPGNY